MFVKVETPKIQPLACNFGRVYHEPREAVVYGYVEANELHRWDMRKKK